MKLELDLYGAVDRPEESPASAVELLEEEIEQLRLQLRQHNAGENQVNTPGIVRIQTATTPAAPSNAVLSVSCLGTDDRFHLAGWQPGVLIPV